MIRSVATVAFLAVGPALMAAEISGSLTAYGPVWVENVPARSGTTIFAGQSVLTETESRALVTLTAGTHLALASRSRAKISPESVALLEGQGTLTGRSTLFARKLRLETDTPGAVVTANLLSKGRVNVAVASGSARVVDPSGETLATIRAGEALLFGLNGQEQTGRPRSGGQAPGVPDNQKKGTPPPPNDKKSRTPIYILVGAGAAAGVAAAAVGGSNRGS